MALEELNVIEEEDAAGIEDQATLQDDSKKSRFTKKQLIIFGGSALGLLLIIIVLLLLLSSSSESEPLDHLQEIDESLQRKRPVPISDIEKLITKANLLYAQGNRNEALALFKQIAVQSESISYYNLGVARMKNEQYETALDAFKKAISDNENITISAINAAVCALYTNNNALHAYYIELAKSSLQEQSHSPLYSYFKGLIEYYQNRPLEAIANFNHPTSQYYTNEKNYLLSKSYFALNDPLQSIDHLEKVPSDEDLSALGMMYARIGNLDLAKVYLKKAVDGGLNVTQNMLALAHVLLKKGDLPEASTLYKRLYDEQAPGYQEIFPIDVFLEPSQFDLKEVQKRYKQTSYFSDLTNLKILLNYAPYKIFDASQTIGIIKKGSANIFMEDMEAASHFLKKSTHFSKVNKIIAASIEDSLHQRLYSSLERLQEAVKLYPKHSILNYDLALTYAKTGDLAKANVYFTKSYYQDAKNYLAGIFAIMTGKAIGQDPLKLKEIFRENIDTEINNDDILLIKALFSFYEHNYPAITSWESEKESSSTLRDTILLLTYKRLNKQESIEKYATSLIKSAPNDTLSDLLYIHSMYRDLPNTEFSTKALQYLAQKELSLNSIFHGSLITEEMFVDLTFVTGHLYDLLLKLKAQQMHESQNMIPITRALARTSLYLTKYEEAYVLYNTLIDEYKQKDTNMLFQTALAATAAKHHANAIALLELANLRDKYNLDSRYALGLLYLESKNYNAASMQFNKIVQENFHSNYFNFLIDSKNIGRSLPVIK